jgi:MraZ protein
MFRGSASAKIDDKGRLKMPTHFRRLLEERYGSELFITSVDGRSALVYPMPVWEEREAALAALPSTDRARQKFLERVNYYGQEASLDAQGRVVLPPLLREAAGLDAEVVVTGQLTYLAIWDRQQLAKRLAEEAFTDDDARSLSERGI